MIRFGAQATVVLRDAAGFEMVHGDADFGFDYALDAMPDGSVQARIDNAELTLRDILVRTFGAVTSTGQTNDRDVLVLPDLHIRGGALRWPEQAVKVDDVEINNAAVSIYRDAAGALNIVPQRDEPQNRAGSAPVDRANGNDWSVSLDFRSMPWRWG